MIGSISLRLALTLAALATPATAAAPLSEARALWVSRFDWSGDRSPETLRTIMRNAAECHFNIVLFQVRGEATAFYRSSHEPWAGELTGSIVGNCGQDPGWDPLAVAVQEAHAAGLELHAYMNVLPGWQQKTDPPKSSGHVRAVHPEWFMYDRNGKPMPVTDIYACLNPAHPEVKAHLTAVFDEVAANYAIDGVHLDYIRYPAEYKNGDLSHDPVSYRLFEAQYGGAPDDMPAEWARFRIEAVNDVVKRIYTTVKARNPNLMVSAAVFASVKDALNSHRQDSLAWLNGGYIDCLMPMNYASGYDLYRERSSVFLQSRQRGLIYMGLWARYGADTMVRQIEDNRTQGAHGTAVYCYSNLFDNHKPNATARALKEKLFGAPARITGRLYND